MQRNLFVSFYCIYLNSDKLLGPYFRHLNPLEERIYYVCVCVCMYDYICDEKHLICVLTNTSNNDLPSNNQSGTYHHLLFLKKIFHSS